MKAPIRIRALTDDERAAVEAGFRSSDASVLRRCQLVLASARGETPRLIGAALSCSDQWGRDVVHGFNAAGLVSLERRSRRPHTIRVAFDAASCERLRGLLPRGPREFGKPTSVWTLVLVAEVCTEEGTTRERVSHETIRNTLTRLDLRWQRAKDWIVSPDPAYARKKLDRQTRLDEVLLKVLQVGVWSAPESQLLPACFLPVVERRAQCAPRRDIRQPDVRYRAGLRSRGNGSDQAHLPAHDHRWRRSVPPGRAAFMVASGAKALFQIMICPRQSIGGVAAKHARPLTAGHLADVRHGRGKGTEGGLPAPHLSEQPPVLPAQIQNIALFGIPQQVRCAVDPGVGLADGRPVRGRRGESARDDPLQPREFHWNPWTPLFSRTRSMEAAIAVKRSWRISPDADNGADNGARPSSVSALRTAKQ